jgi:hypothetical protein
VFIIRFHHWQKAQLGFLWQALHKLAACIPHLYRSNVHAADKVTDMLVRLLACPS